jgi:hypothetical protein
MQNITRWQQRQYFRMEYSTENWRLVIPILREYTRFNYRNPEKFRAPFASNVRNRTACRCPCGTSMPIVPLPGIGAVIRTKDLARPRASSSSRCLKRETRIPGAGTTS